MTHECFRGHVELASFAGACSGSVTLVEEGDCRTGGRLCSFSSLYDDCVSFLLSPDDLLKSNAVPALFGVFAAPPKLANAPVPSPKADDAPDVVGDAIGLEGAFTALKGLFFALKLP